ncbi:MAG: NfeD family protein [Gammaproteobacteria bacterium]|nr:NfeD family protein [Gammaproteobacteria bacterium]
MIVDYIANHQAEFWVITGFILLAVEVGTGFVIGVFLFTGLGALVTGLLMMASILPETWIVGVACTGISSGLIATALWKPLKKLQGEGVAKKDNSSDLVGYEFITESDISMANPGSTQYSGISWKVEIDRQAGVETIASGQRVVVTSVEVGRFIVKPVE